MRKTTLFSRHKQPYVTRQDVFHAFILIALSLLFCLIPKYGLGQSLPEHNSFPAIDLSSDWTTDLQTPGLAPAEPAAVSTLPPPTGTPFEGASISPTVEQFYRSPALEAPTAATAAASPLTASPYQQTQSLPQNPQREVAVVSNTEHPFRQYWGMSNDPQTKMTGKAMSVAELLSGVRSPSTRCQLLQAYWELGGLLAVYHFRCETERLTHNTNGGENMLTLLQEQRRTAELEFIKQQWVLAELLKQSKGRTLRESELPIPADYPLYPRYQTYAERFARSERTQHLGRMIPIQEQLIESKNGTWMAASEMRQNATQPFFVISNQRTMAFLDLTGAIIEYNKMIAEYATETIPPNVNPQQFLAAVVRLPKPAALPMPPQALQAAAQEITLTSYEGNF